MYIRVCSFHFRYMDDNGGSGAVVEEDEDIDDENHENYDESNDTDASEYEEVNETGKEITKIETKSVTEKVKEEEKEKERNMIEKDFQSKMKIDQTTTEMKNEAINKFVTSRGNSDNSAEDKNENTTEKKSDITCEKNTESNFTRKQKKALTVGQRHKKMTEALCDVLSDFGLVSFLPMNVQDGEVRTMVLPSNSICHSFLFFLFFCTCFFVFFSAYIY
jgi:hypothetical protein